MIKLYLQPEKDFLSITVERDLQRNNNINRETDVKDLKLKSPEIKATQLPSGTQHLAQDTLWLCRGSSDKDFLVLVYAERSTSFIDLTHPSIEWLNNRCVSHRLDLARLVGTLNWVAVPGFKANTEILFLVE